MFLNGLRRNAKPRKKRLNLVKEKKKKGAYYWHLNMGESVIKEEIRLDGDALGYVVEFDRMERIKEIRRRWKQ